MQYTKVEKTRAMSVILGKGFWGMGEEGLASSVDSLILLKFKLLTI